jgi:osmotically-inducible protein OsmY
MRRGSLGDRLLYREVYIGEVYTGEVYTGEVYYRGQVNEHEKRRTNMNLLISG